MKGIVRGFDAFTVVLESPGKPAQLVYKHAVASVVPARPVSAATPREEKEPAPARQSAPAAPQPAPDAEAQPAAEPAGE